MAPHGDGASGLSTYWVDLLLSRLEHSGREAGVEALMLSGNATELIKLDDTLVARAIYDTFGDETVPLARLIPLFREWRELILARGGAFDIPQTYRRNPYPMAAGPSSNV